VEVHRNSVKMKNTHLENATPASEDLVVELGSIIHCETSNLPSTTSTTEYYRYYDETKINALTLENAKLTEENDSLTNDMIALSHECYELEHEFSVERNANEQLARTIDVLSHECEELVQDSLKHQPSSTTENNKKTIQMQEMKQKLKNAAEERTLLKERVATVERESADMDSYIRFLERNSTETPALGGKRGGVLRATLI
jgi:chromosome segregation ATPase